jgi:hypothetical protein
MLYLLFFWFLVFEIRGIEVGLHTVHIISVSQTGRLRSTARVRVISGSTQIYPLLVQ